MNCNNKINNINICNKEYSPFSNALFEINNNSKMNSILQCFANIGLLTSYLLQNEKYKNILSNKNNCKLTFEYIEILINLWKKKIFS